MKYRKKPVVVEAIQWTGANTTEILRWMLPDLEPDAEANALTIKTLEGDMKAATGDFIIRGIKGEFYPCKPDIFAASYDLVHDDE